MVNKPANKQETTTTTVSSYYPPTQEPFLDEFEKNSKTYQLFKEKGLDKDIAGVMEYGLDAGKPISTVRKILDEGLFRRLRPFLVNVDASKGPIQRKVIKLERRKGTKSQEFLVVHTEWVAKDYLGNQIVSPVILEGMYNEPLVNNTIVKGKIIKKYQNWQPVYDIPFSVEEVNKALANQINEPEFIKCMVRTSKAERDDTYSIEQFRDSTFEECIEIHKQGKGQNR